MSKMLLRAGLGPPPEPEKLDTIQTMESRINAWERSVGRMSGSEVAASDIMRDMLNALKRVKTNTIAP